MFTGVTGGAHIVNDLELSVAFYADNFGLVVDATMPPSSTPELATLIGIPGVATQQAFLSQGDTFRLLLIEFLTPKGRPSIERNDAGCHMVGFSSDDLEADCATLIAKGVRLAGEITTFGDGRKLAWGLDVDGVILRLAQSGVRD